MTTTTKELEQLAAAPDVGSKEWKARRLRSIKIDADFIAELRGELDESVAEAREHGVADLDIQAALGKPLPGQIWEFATKQGLTYYVSQAEADAAVAGAKAQNMPCRVQMIALPTDVKRFADMMQDQHDRVTKAVKK